MTPQAQGSLPGVAPELREDWDAWSHLLGAAISPRLERLYDSLPTLIGAMACTGDGLNIAAVGVDVSQVGKVAALSSSVFAVAAAHREAMSPGEDVSSTMVNIGGADFQCVLQRLDVAHLGQLLLVVAARDVTLGVLLVATRSVGEDIRRYLEGHA
ncbi:hypothetical protein [Arsenicicoccus dermatophilus]|uniref:hypothetical protein n=1 Tax=Arsenicicoccus dermatophilus TaxID=1076331 RepID=UPI001F4D0128|nr:hypothetical protein [Arsenicicoccus dermatophilus]MCH8612836.1 hypothetical protein [Arsenicicoccus dermatophilus]